MLRCRPQRYSNLTSKNTKTTNNISHRGSEDTEKHDHGYNESTRIDFIICVIRKICVRISKETKTEKNLREEGAAVFIGHPIALF